MTTGIVTDRPMMRALRDEDVDDVVGARISPPDETV